MRNTKNIVIKGDYINFSSLTTKQKIAQMIIVRGDIKKNLFMLNENIGGIFLDNLKTKEDYFNMIKKYQESSKIKLFVATDMEGAWNPFPFYESIYFSQINSSNVAYKVGLEHGEILKDMGFNVNFAPVAEFIDNSYGGRTFLGNKKDVKEKLISYIQGLQKNVYPTCKHYPGKGMINNLHYYSDSQIIEKEDLELFECCIDKNVPFIMVGHQIVSGELDSKGKPSSVSEDVISSISRENVLIISDEINMKGLSKFYKNKVDLYKDLINSGENLILDFYIDYKELVKLLDKLEEKVNLGEIEIQKIDNSVTKILKLKGYNFQ
ncbi:MAG: glycoside hydrolase family 3 N-terminal domain-containing protein [Candidatus Pacearchaeota archaeon]